jgi:diadenosine tetraphosphate (Ap4A) HIT family hydrolase
MALEPDSEQDTGRTRRLNFLDGSTYVVDRNACRGCFMNEREGQLPSILSPIIDDGFITVRQDAEWAVPGFMVIGVRPHIGTIGEMPLELAHRVTTLMHFVRKGMRDRLGVAMVHIYQEEKEINSHYHVWLLPLWPQVMRRHGINPRIYESNIAHYIRMFDFQETRDDIRRCNAELRQYLAAVDLLRHVGLSTIATPAID